MRVVQAIALRLSGLVGGTALMILDGEPTDLERTEALRTGDRCEFRYPAGSEWMPGTVVRNGGAGYWTVDPDEGKRAHGLYIEHVRAPGTDPWLS